MRFTPTVMEVGGMIKPDSKAMSCKGLYGYVLTHRDDQEAFYTFVDELHAEANWVEMPPSQSVENYPKFIEHLRKSSEPHDKAN